MLKYLVHGLVAVILIPNIIDVRCRRDTHRQLLINEAEIADSSRVLGLTAGTEHTGAHYRQPEHQPGPLL